MATAEGVFPKVGDDPLYASEVNDFYDRTRSPLTKGDPVVEATEYTSSVFAYVTVDTLVFTAPVDCVIVGYKLGADVKSGGVADSTGGARIKIGALTGSILPIPNLQTTYTDEIGVFLAETTTGKTVLTGATLNIELQLKGVSLGGTVDAFIKNTNVWVYYMEIQE